MAKRKPGKREKNGRLQRDPKDETEWLTMEHVLQRRCRELGWYRERTDKKTGKMERTYRVEDMRKVRGHEGGTLWGQLYLLKQIERPEYEAASAFVSLRERWLASIAAPGSSSSSWSAESISGSLSSCRSRL